MSASANPEFMQRAIRLACENVRSGNGGPFAALIVKDGVVVAEAANSVTSTNDPTAHGEVNAIRQACKTLGTFTLQGCEMYSSCEPCPMCLAAIYWARIETVYFGCDCEDAARAGFDDSFLYKELRLPRSGRMLKTVQLMPTEAWESFQTWIDAENKVDY